MTPPSKQSPGSQQLTIQQALDLALEHHEAGSLAEAEGIYRQILEAEPEHPVALHFLGVLAHQSGNNAAAAELITQALAIRPDTIEAHNNLGLVLLEQGKADAAASCFHQALAINPDYAEALNNLGNAQEALGQLDDAAASHRKAVALRPDDAELHSNLGFVLEKQGLLEDAFTSHQVALSLNPNDPGCHNNSGVVLRKLGLFKDAVAAHQKALALLPDDPVTLTNLGQAQEASGLLDEAAASYRKALALYPDHFTAHANLGNTLQGLGKFDEAVASYRRALAIKPDSAVTHSNLLMSLNYGAEVKEADILEEARNWNRRHAAGLKQSQDHANDRSPERRLKIGYVSSDMRKHSISYFFEPLLAAHDPVAVENFCYAGTVNTDDTTERLKASADHWRNTVGVGDAALADTIRADGIDILVDLAGHSAGNRLTVFARRPAPVQANWLGSANTTGLEVMDYRIVDRITDPEDMTTETLVRLANCFMCYLPPEGAPPVAPPRPTGPVTFGSFNAITKVTERSIDLWSRVLAEVPNARLLLKSRRLGNEGSREAYRDAFAQRGVDPARLDLRGRTKGTEAHLGVYADVGVCLDPFPYNGATTTCEALWMGVPVVTLAGRYHRSRVGASLLTRIGLEDCVAADDDSYVAIAAGLARDHDRRAELRAGLRDLMAPLCDADGFARDMETAYRSMWLDWCERA